MKLFIKKNCLNENKRILYFERFILVYRIIFGNKNVNFFDFIVIIFRFGIIYVYFFFWVGIIYVYFVII